MATARKPASHPKLSTLMVRLDEVSKKLIERAAELRGMSVSDYVRTVLVPQARREVQGAEKFVIVMTPEEQLAFWNALNEPPKLTPAQKKLGAIMRGEE
jgi:uncharacterized protein (DUF1778 family)